jgi:hypothetical protein
MFASEVVLFPNYGVNVQGDEHTPMSPLLLDSWPIVSNIHPITPLITLA